MLNKEKGVSPVNMPQLSHSEIKSLNSVCPFGNISEVVNS